MNPIQVTASLGLLSCAAVAVLAIGLQPGYRRRTALLAAEGVENEESLEGVGGLAKE